MRIDPEVLKSLKKFPPKDAQRIVAAIENLPANPYQGDIQKMKGEEAENTIHVFHIERRTTQTY